MSFYLEPLQTYRTRKEAERDILRYIREARSHRKHPKYKKSSFVIKQTFMGEYTLYFKETRNFGV